MMSSKWAQILGGLALGVGYWYGVSRVSGAAEPWDAAHFWTMFYPLAVALAAMLGYLMPHRAWLWGALLMVALLMVVAIGSAFSPLLIVGLIFTGLMAIPAALVAEGTGRLRRRILRRLPPGAPD